MTMAYPVSSSKIRINMAFLLWNPGHLGFSLVPDLLQVAVSEGEGVVDVCVENVQREKLIELIQGLIIILGHRLGGARLQWFDEVLVGDVGGGFPWSPGGY